jgi:glutathionyl-hydroquinone reductase
MGLLVDGIWRDEWYDTKSTGGCFVRKDSTFRNWVTPDGYPGPSGVGGFRAERGRYHLYVSLACPWAHRTLVFRKLKGLESLIGVSIVHWLMLDNGWTFADDPGVVPDPVHGARFLHEVYTRAEPRYTGRVTVPILWDKVSDTIVNNESSEIIRMFNSGFDACGAAPGDYYPEELRPGRSPRRRRPTAGDGAAAEPADCRSHRQACVDHLGSFRPHRAAGQCKTLGVAADGRRRHR